MNQDDPTVASYLKAYKEKGDIWKEKEDRYHTSATEFFVNSLLDKSLVLDQGCGTSIISEMILSKGHLIQGFDISSEAIQIGKERLLKAGNDCSQFNLWIEDLKEYKYPPSKFDGIVDYYTLHHFKKEEQMIFLRGIISSLKFNGLFLLGICTSGLFSENSSKITKQDDGGIIALIRSPNDRRYFYLWDPDDLQVFIESLGFQTVHSLVRTDFRACEFVFRKI